jgi:imidazolonepropionase-like amidohydrolase
MPTDFDQWTAAPAIACVLALLAGPAAAQARALPERHAIAITDVTVIDVEHGRSVGPRTVLIDDGRIVAVVAPGNAHVAENTQRVAGLGRFLIPGLVDMHVHLFNNASHRPPNDWSFPLFIANGVTAVREMNAAAATIATVNRWRKELDDGELTAPRILAAGVSVYGRSPQDAAAQVDAAADAGADFIKIFSDVPVAHWRAILDAARARSLPVAGHVPAAVPLLVAATAGQRSSEHLMQAYEACSSLEAQLLQERQGLTGDALIARSDAQEARTLATFDRATCRRIATALAATGQAQVPTLVLPHEESTRGNRPTGDDPRWRYLRADERARWQRLLAGVASHDDALAKRRWDVSRRIVSALHRANVPILAGTDTPMPGIYPGFALHEELALLVESGLTPREALRSATLVPAQFLGLAATSGAVSVGKRADLVLLDADPATDIRNTRRIDAVLLDGRLLRRADLDALLEEAADAMRR